jgi:hypothetical protein
MKREPELDIIQNYILPIILAIVILAVSQLINLVSIRDLLEASGLCAVIITGLFMGQFVAFKTLRVQERDALYGILSIITFSGSASSPRKGMISQHEVLGLESTAYEVWVFVFNLNYESFEEGRTPFTNAVVENLERGVRYKYLIPDSPELIARARRMHTYLRQYASTVKQLEFRVAACAPIFNQFSVTLYNPSSIGTRRTDQKSDGSTAPVAVYFPHAEEVDLNPDQSNTVFTAIRGASALNIQENLESLFESSKPLGRGEGKSDGFTSD